MRLRTLAFASAAVVVLAPAPSVAQDDSSSEAAGYLEKIAGADQATYRARQIVVYFGSPQSAAVVDVRSSQDGQFLRAEAGESVTRLWRRADLGVLSRDEESVTDAAPPPTSVQPAAVLEKYEIEVEKPVELLGVKVVPLALERRSDRAMLERLWVHPRSGVVYRRELYEKSGKLVAMSAILDMNWGEDVPAEQFESSGQAPSRARSGAGGKAPLMLTNGYKLQREYRVSIGGRSAEQWVYSDGLHALSVFRTEGGLSAPAGFVPEDFGDVRGWVGPGPGTWAWEGRGATWVLVAEEPSLDPALLTSAFPRGGPSVWARMGSVWARAFRAIGGLVD
jgi:hypothetical protein